MSEHRRKPPQGRGRRAAQQPRQPQQPEQSPRPPGPPQQSPRPPTSRPAPPREATTSSYGPSQPPGAAERAREGHSADERPQGGRAEARRAAGRSGGGRRRVSASGAGAGEAAGATAGGRAASRSRARGAQASGRTGKKRFIDYPRSGKSGFRRWMPSWKQITGTFVGFLGLMMGLAGIAYAMVDIPNNKKAIATSEQNVYYWADKSRMVSTGSGKNRQIIPLEQIPLSMQHAVIAAENESFYEDSGISPMGIARAAFRMATGGPTQSGSTITQQYVKNTYLSQEQTISRKVKEMLIAIKVDAKLEKEEILAGYLNTAYYGRNAYGIQAAAHAYFRKDASDLNPSETAFLAATLKGPNLYDPYGGLSSVPAQSPEKNKERAKARWKWILGREVEVGKEKQKNGWSETAAKAKKWLKKGFPDVEPPPKSDGLKGQIGYLVKLANQDVLTNPNSDISQHELLEQGGLQIYTTFEKDKVHALRDTIKKIKKKNIKPEERKEDRYVQFGGASVRPDDGAVVAIYGGESATTHFMNNADYTGAQVGSTFKPYVMAAALRNGVRDPDGPPEQGPAMRTKVSPKSIYNGDDDLKVRNYDGTVWLNDEGKPWVQTNESDTSYGNITLREAMRVSANTPFVQLGMDIGLEKVKKAALDAGLNEDSLATLSPTFSLGTSSPSAIRMATGYATFAASGVQADPYSVTKVKNGSEVLYKHQPDKERVFDASVADTITSMLHTVATEGTGTRTLELGRPVAGKTGTTDDNKHAWFTGYTPQLSTSIGMWRLNDQKEGKQGFLPMYGTAGEPQIHGASFPADVWTEYMAKALEGEPVKSFPEPAPIGEKVCGLKSCPELSPSPTPDPSESTQSPTQSPSPSTSPSQSPSPTPTPSDTCGWGDWNCDEPGTTTGPGGDSTGADSGGSDGGADGGMDSGGTGGDPEGGTEGTTNGGNGGNGGWFGGTDSGSGARREGE